MVDEADDDANGGGEDDDGGGEIWLFTAAATAALDVEPAMVE